jgi:murein DD-endopeptidase MepM/ murein hydrolase activator NlpD
VILLPQGFQGMRRLGGLTGHPSVKRLINWFNRQPLLRRIGIGTATYLFVSLIAYAVLSGNACMVMAGGRPVATAAGESEARQALKELAKEKSAQVGLPVAVAENVKYKSIRANKEDILDKPALVKRLGETLIFKAEAASVFVDGSVRVTLKNREDAQKLLEWVRLVYPAQSGEQLAFKEQVEVTDRLAETGEIVDFEQAKNLVLLGTDKIQKYKVKDGDTLWDITASAGVSMDRLQSANPGLDMDNISIDQELVLSKSAPLLTVVATREVTLDEDIPYPVETVKDDSLLFGEKRVVREGENGQRNIKYRIVRENGLETGREVLAENVMREATPEVVARGSLTMLASRGGGSARLNWPCSGGVLSPFGMRGGRMHQGVDLDCGYGGAITAAAGGRVIAAGWEGGYGKAVVISHGNGLVTRYAHLSSIEVSPGQNVDRGQLVGLGGSTGNSTGPHLHFELIVGGEPRNPMNYL